MGRLPLRTAVFAAVAALLASAALTACGGNGDDADLGEARTNPIRETEAGEPLAPKSVVVQLSALDDSGPRGTATLAPLAAGGDTRVTIALRDAAEGEQPAAIRRGNCEQPGDTVEELEPVTNGSSDSTLERSLEELVDDEPDMLVVAVGEPGDGGAYACGPLPAQTKR